MLVRVVRGLTPEEVRTRIKALKKEHGMTFEEIEELYLERKIDKNLFSAYFEWAGLVHEYRSYVESGEFDYIVEEVREMNPEETALLTPRRLELLYSLAKLRVESINHLSQKVHRNVKNVYHDLKALKDLGFVTFRKRGKRNIIPETLVEEIIFLIR